MPGLHCLPSFDSILNVSRLLPISAGLRRRPRGQHRALSAPGTAYPRRAVAAGCVGPSSRHRAQQLSLLSLVSFSHHRPQEPHQFPRHGHHHLAHRLAAGAEGAEAPVEPRVRPVGMRDGPGWLANAAAAQPSPHLRPMAVMVRSFHQDPPDVGIATLGDAAPAPPLATGVLGADQADVTHQVTRSLEPVEAMQLRHTVSIPWKQRSQPTASR